ncbi:MAG: UvrD-helicase domain-containing protein [Flavobacteriales bacterium]|nr:UvrD-helicase domain-containing protein [Flavobacteriales bacterium]
MTKKINNKELVIYRSSAGSGKTFTLVLNYLTLILESQNPFKFSEVLAITFTNKAASEMKNRVFEHLQELAKNDSNSEIMSIYAEQLNLSKTQIASTAENRLSIMLHNYSDVAIITIDRFAHRLIRSFSRDLNLQADFEIEMDFPKVLKEAIDQLVSEVGSRADITQLIVHYAKDLASSDRSWKAPRNLFESGKLITNEDTELWLKDIQKLNIKELFELHNKGNIKCRSLQKEIEQLGMEAIKRIQDAAILDWIPRGQKGWYSHFKKASDCDFSAILKPSKSITSALEDGKWLNKNAPESCISSLTNIQDFITNTYHKIDKIALEQHRYQLIREQIIGLGLLKELKLLIDQYKIKNNVVLISDFNKTISEIVLKQPTPFIYERIGGKFKHYFIDEFQDTSVQQWQNFIPLIDDSLAQGYKNLLVGDAKQAIYRFRNGEAKQFVMLPKIYNKKDTVILQQAEQTFIRQIDVKNLAKNYRSTATIVNFNNLLFTYIKSIMPTSISDNYDEYEQIPVKKELGYVQINLEKLNQRNLSKERRDFEEKATLSAINDCINDGFRLSDITILVRTNTIGQEIANFLLKTGIAVTSSDSLHILENKKVQVLIALLKVLENIHIQSDVMKVLAFFCTSNLTENAKNLNLRKTADKGKNALLKIINSQFNTDIEKWQSEPLYNKARSIINVLFSRSEQDQFVESFMENVHNFVSSKGEDINAFFDWLQEKNPSIDAAEEEDAVQIMTIHKSKGLEFNVVILHKCNWELGPSRRSKVWTSIEANNTNYSIQIHPSEQSFQSLNKVQEYEEAFSKEYLDGLNLFYVATTRPVHRLYMNASSINKNNISQVLSDFISQKQEVKYPMNWIMGQREKANIERNLETSEDFTYEKNKVLKIEVTGKNDFEELNAINQKAWGKLVHLGLELVHNKEEIKMFADKFVLVGQLKKKDAELLKKQLINTLNHPVLKNWLCQNFDEKREKEIIDSDGNSYRPDRVVFQPDSTILIDFKTGIQKQKDIDQIRSYNKLLLDLGYSNIKNYLFYVLKAELIKV